jgi:hypothetical protein
MRCLAWLLCLVSAPALAATTQQFAVIFTGRTSGEQRTTIRDDGTREVFFTYRTNGRGPDIEETIEAEFDPS